MVKGVTKKRYNVKRNMSKKRQRGGDDDDYFNGFGKIDDTEAQEEAAKKAAELEAASQEAREKAAAAKKAKDEEIEAHCKTKSPKECIMLKIVEKMNEISDLDIGFPVPTNKERIELNEALNDLKVELEKLIAEEIQKAVEAAKGQLAEEAKADLERRLNEKVSTKAKQQKIKELTADELDELRRRAKDKAQEKLGELERQKEFLEQEKTDIATLTNEIKALIGIKSGEGTEIDFAERQKDIKTELKRLREEKARLEEAKGTIEREKGTIEELTRQKESLLGEIEGIQKADGELSRLRSKKAGLDKAVRDLTAEIEGIQKADGVLYGLRTEKEGLDEAVNSLTAEIGELKKARDALAELKLEKETLEAFLETIWYRILQKILLKQKSLSLTPDQSKTCAAEVKERLGDAKIKQDRWNSLRVLLKTILTPEAQKLLELNDPCKKGNTFNDFINRIKTKDLALKNLCGTSAAPPAAGGARNTKKKRRGQGRRRIRSKLVRKVNKSSNKKNKKSSIKRNKN